MESQEDKKLDDLDDAEQKLLAVEKNFREVMVKIKEIVEDIESVKQLVKDVKEEFLKE